MKESRGNIVTLVQNVVVSCKQTYTLPEISVRDNGSVATGSSRSRPCFNAEPPRSSRERQFEIAWLSRSAPESTFVSQLHTFSRRPLEKTLPFRKQGGEARALHTPPRKPPRSRVNASSHEPRNSTCSHFPAPV